MIDLSFRMNVTWMSTISYTRPSQWWYRYEGMLYQEIFTSASLKVPPSALRPPSFWQQMSPEAMLHQLQPQSPVSAGPHQSHGRKCLKRHRILSMPLAMFTGSSNWEGISTNIYTWIHAPLFDILKADVKSMQMEWSKGFYMSLLWTSSSCKLNIKDNKCGQQKNHIHLYWHCGVLLWCIVVY